MTAYIIPQFSKHHH